MSFLLDSTSILNGPVDRGAASKGLQFGMIKKDANLLLAYFGFLDSKVHFQLRTIDESRWLCTCQDSSLESYRKAAFKIFLDQGAMQVKKMEEVSSSSYSEETFLKGFESLLQNLDHTSTITFDNYNDILKQKSSGSAGLNILNLTLFKNEALINEALLKLDDPSKRADDKNPVNLFTRGFNNGFFYKTTNKEDVQETSENKKSFSD